MTKLWPFKVGTATIMIARNRLNKGAGRKFAIFGNHDHENTLGFVIMIMGLPGENVKYLLKP